MVVAMMMTTTTTTTTMMMMRMIMIVVVVMMTMTAVIFYRTVDRFLSFPLYGAPYPRRVWPQLFVCAVLASLPRECADDVNGGARGRILFGRHRLNELRMDK